MNLIIDIGNTTTKMAVFDSDELIYKNSFLSDVLTENLKRIQIKFDIKHTILSNVSKKLSAEIMSSFHPLILNTKTQLPFINNYKTPETLGVDRIALVAAAVHHFRKKNVLIIDAGSCITYDFVNEKSIYFGGSISPGIEMRYKAIHSFTANLPKLNLINQIPETGNTTQNAIHKGVLNGIILEIEGIIAQYRRNYQKLTVVLTGGDTIFLAKNIKSTIFANPNFLLEGLNQILIHNTDE